MLKEVCPECDNPLSSFEGGDGNCNECGGTGITNMIVAAMDGVTRLEEGKCLRCDGTGKCPRCEGIGWIEF